MRLLQCTTAGQLSLTKDLVGDDILEYAILSHTWGADTDEVTFRDLIEKTGKSKAGYKKIHFCKEQARRDNIQYFWVDTCCIDKSNSVELQEAINSMFRWYRNAAKCYVYLSDVSTRKRKASDKCSKYTWESAFRKSRWFTRGWTLQELIAPPSVEFFSLEGKPLGDKTSLKRQIHEITGLAFRALQGSALFEFSVAERMSWAEKRETKCEEDMAYSLLGIFDIHMPLIYGEGMKNAFRRLREEIEKCSSTDRSRLLSSRVSTQSYNSLNGLPFAVDAPFNSYQRQHEPTCLDNTRVDILHEIYTWADGQDERCIFWLNGLAGTGKSTIARTVARKYFEKNRLGASFFFTKGGGDVGHASKFVTSVAIQLANSVPTLRQYICDAVAEQSDITNQSLWDQWHELICRPLSNLNSNGCYFSYILVVDALDECNNDNNIQIILQLLAKVRSIEKVRLRVFLTSRPEILIRHKFNQMPDTEHQDFVLHSISPSIINNDIFIFLEYNLKCIKQERFLDDTWPGEKAIRHLVQIASGLFIWAATACRFIREGKRFAAKRLDIILESGGSVVTAPERHLDEIYTTVLKHSITPEYTNEEKKELYYMLKKILGSIAIIFSPLSVHSLSNLLSTTKEDINQTLEDLHSVLDVPKDQNRPLRLHHPSFRDFLLNNDRCKNLDFWVHEKLAHQTLADSCIQLMSISLKQDVCGLNTPGVLISDVESSRIECSLPPEVQYACFYWIQHFHKSGVQLHDDDQVHQFLQAHLLHWLEALGWMQKVSESIYAITSLESIAAAYECPRLSKFVYDTKRFVLYNRPVIEQAPLQTYCSALIFAPATSIVRKQFENCVPRWVQRLPEVENNWNALVQTLEAHMGRVRTIVFSPDYNLLASASDDKTVKLWDASSGAALQTLEGHSGSVNAVAFSPDSKLLASASNDETVKLWDASSGAALQTLEGHSGSVNAVAFSPDSKLLASASNDKTVKLWDTGLRTAVQTLKGHLSYVCSIAFSLNGKLLVSASDDKTVKLWDASSGAALQTLEGHSGSVNAVAFSPDSKLLASASNDKTVRLWDASSGAALQTLEGHSCSVSAVAFSPDGKLLASSSYDHTIELWDTGSKAALQTLEGHLDLVTAVAFSPDGKLLASSSYDCTIKLWDTGATSQTPNDYLPPVSVVTFSPDGKLLASALDDGTVKLWDTASGAVSQTLEGHSSFIYTIAFSPDSKALASVSHDNTTKLWDTSSGAVLQTLEGHLNLAAAVVFSPNGKLLASASNDYTIKLSDTSLNVVLQTLKSHLNHVRAIAFSPNSKVLASASNDKTAKLWDANSGTVLQTLKSHLSYVCAVAFSLDGKLLASASNDYTIKLWDANLGVALRTFESHLDLVTAVAFSPDRKLLASSSRDNTIKLWDTGSGVVLQTLKLHTAVKTLFFSNDGTFVQTNRGLLHTVFFSDNVAVSRLNLPRSIFVRKQWVSLDMENLLWIPSDYRSNYVTVHRNTVAYGNVSGRVLFMEFAF